MPPMPRSPVNVVSFWPVAKPADAELLSPAERSEEREIQARQLAKLRPDQCLVGVDWHFRGRETDRENDRKSAEARRLDAANLAASIDARVTAAMEQRRAGRKPRKDVIGVAELVDHALKGLSAIAKLSVAVARLRRVPELSKRDRTLQRYVAAWRQRKTRQN
jgi:hypothetical protein